MQKQYYHASKCSKLNVKRQFKTRYGFPLTFLTDNLQLVKMYYQEYKGDVICIDFSFPDLEIDYKSKSSYSVDFRNLIFKLKKENHKSVLLKNVLDYPTQKMKRIIISDILIIFDSSLLHDYKSTLL